MKLKKWLATNGKSTGWLAEQLGKDRTTAHKYVDGTRTPTLKTAIKIQELTNNEVTCKELLGK